MSDELEIPKNEIVPLKDFRMEEVYTSTSAFEHIQRIAKVFSSSDLVPELYRGKLANCIIAIEMSMRMDVPILMFMQNASLVHGKPGLDGKFVIALVNQRGPYKDGIEFLYDGEGPTRSCTAQGRTASGAVHSAKVDVAMAKEIGWWARNPLWAKMTDQMLAYRSATWLARKHHPELLCGLPSVDEIMDIVDVTPSEVRKLNETLKKK